MSVTQTIKEPAGSSAKKGPIAKWIFSSIGKKTIVAATGIGLVLFVIGHLVGNLTIFAGPNAINAYGQQLKDLGLLLWVARIGLLACVGLHIYFTMLLWAENRQARPNKYLYSNRIQSTIFARTMRLSGLIVLAFVIFHLAHFTLQIVQPEVRTWVDAEGRHDIYRMVVAGFSNPVISLFYIISLALLTFHLSHGIGSLFQTLGLSNSHLRPQFTLAGKALAWLLFVGYAAIPTSILIGLVKYPVAP